MVGVVVHRFPLYVVESRSVVRSSSRLLPPVQQTLPHLHLLVTPSPSSIRTPIRNPVVLPSRSPTTNLQQPTPPFPPKLQTLPAQPLRLPKHPRRSTSQHPDPNAQPWVLSRRGGSGDFSVDGLDDCGLGFEEEREEGEEGETDEFGDERRVSKEGGEGFGGRESTGSGGCVSEREGRVIG